jgi:hypothetical protein
MFLGALTILRGLPEEIKRFIADRKHYDFPVEKYVKIPSIDSLCPVEDSLCPVEDSLCQNGGKKGIGYAKNAENSAHDSDSDSDSDLDLDLDLSGGGRSEYSDPPTGKNPVPEEPPPPILHTVKKNAREAGFSVDNTIARKFLASGLDPGWFSGAHNFLAFMAHNVRAKYPKEPPERQRDIFINAIAWDNLRETYPAWREQRQALDRERAVAHARDHPPEICPGCGAKMQGHRCPKCDGFVEFRDATVSWDFIPPPVFDFCSDKIRHKEIPKPVIDF